MIEILHDLKDPKLWELGFYSLLWGNAKDLDQQP